MCTIMLSQSKTKNGHRLFSSDLRSLDLELPVLGQNGYNKGTRIKTSVQNIPLSFFKMSLKKYVIYKNFMFFDKVHIHVNVCTCNFFILLRYQLQAEQSFCLSDYNEDHLSLRAMEEVYYLWQLAGGELFGALKREGLVKTKPPIHLLPQQVIFCRNIMCSIFEDFVGTPHPRIIIPDKL